MEPSAGTLCGFHRGHGESHWEMIRWWPHSQCGWKPHGSNIGPRPMAPFPSPTYEVELHLELVVKQAAIQVAIHTGVNGTKIYTSYVDLVQYQPEKWRDDPLRVRKPWMMIGGLGPKSIQLGFSWTLIVYEPGFPHSTRRGWRKWTALLG